VIVKTRWVAPAVDDNSGTPPVALLHEPAARQAFDALLAIQMQIELATGVPVAIYGPTGQTLPGISPIKSRLALTQQTLLARDVLAASSWPRSTGQMLEVTSANNLHFFITPFVLSGAPIAQIILGPLHLFEPGAQESGASHAEAAALISPGGGVPVLASWRAKAAAEIARTLVSKLSLPAAENPAGLSSPEPPLTAPDQETLALPIVGRPAPGQQALAPMRLGTLAGDARLPERTPTGKFQRVTESTEMIHTPEDQDTPSLWPAPAQPLSASVYPTESQYGPASVLRHLIEAMPQAVIICAAPDGQVVLANRAARSLWSQWLGGAASENETSAPLRYQVTADDYPPEWLGLRVALDQARLFRSEVSVEIAANEPPASPGDTIVRGPKQRPMLISAFPLYTTQETASHAIAIFEDLSGLLERELFKDELLLVAAHDLRNPLTLMSSHAQLLEHTLARELPPGQLLERARGRLNAIQEQVQQVTELSSQLSTVTRLQSAQQRPPAETVNLARLIQRAAIDQQMLSPGRSIETVVEYDPCPVQGDQTQLEHVCMNLLKNAARSSHPRKPISISLRCTPANTPRWAQVSVRDQGIGIPRACLPHIFERFYRVPGQEQRARAAGIRPPDNDGVRLGLGLYLCKQLIERMGGSIWIESVEGQGTAVSFALPLKW
jgi:signal transduction histidine kinase